MSPPGRPKGEYRSAQHEGTPVSLFVMEGVSKRYGGVHALQGADLAIEAGRIHAVLGENGAGKSTLVSILFGHYVADSGVIEVEGRPLAPGQPGAALETSYANAGQVSPGYSTPWAAPGIPIKAVKWMFMKRRPLFIWPLISPTMWKWGYDMVRNCNEESYRINKGRMVRISNYSRDVMPELIAETGIEYDGREQGTLQLFRTAKQMKASKADQDILAEYDSPFEVLGRDACIGVEPALAERAEHHADGGPGALQHRPLLDMHLKIGEQVFLLARQRRDGGGVEASRFQRIGAGLHLGDGGIQLGLAVLILVHVLHRALIGLNACKFQPSGGVNRSGNRHHSFGRGHAAAARERHLAQRGEQPAVGAVVVGEQQFVGTRELDQVEKRFQRRRFIDVGAGAAEAVVALSEHAAAEALLAGAQADQPDIGIAVDAQLRRGLRGDIFDARERGDDQRHRRGRGQCPRWRESCAGWRRGTARGPGSASPKPSVRGAWDCPRRRREERSRRATCPS